MFDLQKLQEDIIKVYLVGKPLIKDPADHLRVCFKFRVLRPDTIAMGISERDLQILQGYLKENFKVSCNSLRCVEPCMFCVLQYVWLWFLPSRPIKIAFVCASVGVYLCVMEVNGSHLSSSQTLAHLLIV